MEYRAVRSEYSGDVWLGSRVHPILGGLLASPDQLIVLEHGEPPFVVTFGIPHQAPPGTDWICERVVNDDGSSGRRYADENAASYALAAFSRLIEQGLSCRVVVMARASDHDPNKVADSPYCQEIFAHPTGLLFECHGAGKSLASDMELSAGRNRLAHPLLFGRFLAAGLEYRYSLGIQSEPEKYSAQIIARGGSVTQGKIRFAAKKTLSLVLAENHHIHALHLEAIPIFRKSPDRSISLTPDGRRLGIAIAQAVIGYFSG